jgi:hypothetical protein
MIGMDFGISALALRQRNTSGGVAPPAIPTLTNPVGLYDPSDLTTLSQDSAGTTPVGSIGDQIGHLQPLAGGTTLTQVTATRRPVYGSDGTLHWIETDGIDDRLDQTGVTIARSHSVVFGIRVTSTPLSYSAAFAINAATADYQIGVGSQNEMRFNLATASLGVSANQAVNYINQDIVCSLVFDDAANTAVMKLNGLIVHNLTGYIRTSDPLYSIHVMTNRGGGGIIGGRLYALAIWNSADPAEVSAAETWAASKTGVSL